MSNAALNRKYFDSIADSYDSKPWFAKTNAQVSDFLRSKLDWIGIPFANTGSSNDANEVRLLDYACGTGLMTRTLGPYVTQTRGIDVSPNMVVTYNSRMSDAGLSSDTVHAVNGDLFDKSNPNPPEFDSAEWKEFDIATVGFGFHHFEDVVHAATQLKQRLRPGGVLVINDFLEGGDLKADEQGRPVEGSEGNWAIHKHGHKHDHGHSHQHQDENAKHDHEHGHSHAHHHNHGAHGHDDHGHDDKVKHDTSDTSPSFHKKMSDSIVVPHFTIDGVKQFFNAAGFVDVDVVTLPERNYMEFGGTKVWRTILVAKGRRPVDNGKVREAEKSEL